VLAVNVVLGRLPAAAPGRGRVGEFIRDLDAPSRQVLPDAFERRSSFKALVDERGEELRSKGAVERRRLRRDSSRSLR
jgi:hypothetical protein